MNSEGIPPRKWEHHEIPVPPAGPITVGFERRELQVEWNAVSCEGHNCVEVLKGISDQGWTVFQMHPSRIFRDTPHGFTPSQFLIVAYKYVPVEEEGKKYESSFNWSE